MRQLGADIRAVLGAGAPGDPETSPFPHPDKKEVGCGGASSALQPT